MKISICIPQYNRIELLVKSLKRIESQTYDNVEIVISDDCSTDDTEERIRELQKEYRFPIIFSRNEVNRGYDFNYRRCIELATGDYCLVIGNDDTIYSNSSLEELAEFLMHHDQPDIGFCNYVEESAPDMLVQRALESRVVGSGEEIAIAFYNGFSFVGGLIYKKSAFDRFNTSKHDGSIYSQMYLGVLMISSGCRLFTIKTPLVLKDIHFDDGSFRWSYYRDGLPKHWKDYRVMDGGLPSVANVLITATDDARGKYDPTIAFRILKRIYMVTYPFWVTQYKKFGSLAAAIGLVRGMKPSLNPQCRRLGLWGRFRIRFLYWLSSSAAIMTPVPVFELLKDRLYLFVKRHVHT